MLGRCATDNLTPLHILCDNRACSDDRTIPNGYARHYQHMGRDPHILSDYHRFYNNPFIKGQHIQITAVIKMVSGTDITMIGNDCAPFYMDLSLCIYLSLLSNEYIIVNNYIPGISEDGVVSDDDALA